MAIPISDIYVRLGEQNAVTDIKFVQGGWLSTGSLANIQAIDATRVHDKQIAYSTDEDKFYIATKVEASTTPPDPTTVPPTPPSSTPASLTWAVLPIGFPYTGSAGISGSLVVNGPISASLFSGSFYGDGSNLTGIGSGILVMTGSFGSSSVDLDTTALVFTGSANGIVPTVSASHITFELSDELSATGSFSGSFTGSFSGSLSAPGSNGYILYNSGSLVHGTSSLFFDDVNHRVGLGTDTPTTKLDIHGDALITGSLTVQGRVTAEEFHTEFVSASILYQSGSTKFGDTSDDVHSFSGSLRVTGSGDHYFTDGKVGIGTTSPFRQLTVYSEDDSVALLHSSGATARFVIQNDLVTDTYGTAPNIKSKNEADIQYLFNDDTGTKSFYTGLLKDNLVSSSAAVYSIMSTTNTLGGSKAVITQQGNVGIGTLSPAEKLTVAGNISASGDLYLDGALYDVNDEPGTTGQILSSTATGVDWVDPTGISVQAQQVFASVKNLSGGTLYKGTPVHAVSGSSSGNINPVIAASASDASSMPATFVLNEDLNDEEEGLAIAIGFIAGVDTSAFEVGDVVYVGESGGYTNVKPTGSANLIQNLGVVTKKHASNGAGYVYGSGRSNDVPNLPIGKIWVGSDEYSVTSSLVHLDEDNGRMGIGTDTPTTQLQISATSNTIVPLVTLHTNTGTNGSVAGSSIDFVASGNVAATGARIVGTRVADGAHMDLRFHTQRDQFAMIIDEEQNVGIGTTTPGTKLHTVGAGYFSGQTILSQSLSLDQDYNNVGLLIDENDFIFTKDSNSLRKLIGKTSDVIQVGQIGTSLIDGIQLLPGTTNGYVTVHNDGSEYARFQSGRFLLGVTAPTDLPNTQQKPQAEIEYSGYGGLYIHGDNSGLSGANSSSFGLVVSASNHVVTNGGKGYGAYIEARSTSYSNTENYGVYAKSVRRGRAGGYPAVALFGHSTHTPITNNLDMSSDLVGVWSKVDFSDDNIAVTSSAEMYNFYGEAIIPTNKIIDDYYGLYLKTPTVNGTITNNRFGIYQQGSTEVNYFAGNVGIGTSAPDAHLHVEGLGVTAAGYKYHAIIDDNNAYGINNGGGLIFRGDYNASGAKANFASIRAGKSNGNDGNANAYLAFNYGASGTLTEGMRIDYNGNVGIGTTAPETKLHIVQQITANQIEYPLIVAGKDEGNTVNQLTESGIGVQFRLAGNDIAGDSLIGASIAAMRESVSDPASFTGLAFLVSQDDTTLDEAMRIDQDGKVGIGTPNPSDLLHLSASDAAIRLQDADGTDQWSRIRQAGSNLIFTSRNNTTKGQIYFQQYNGTTTTDAMVIRDSGRVGIGTNAPSKKLHVSGGLRLETYGEGDNVSNDIVYALGVDSSGNVLEIPQNTGANVDVDTGTEVVDSFASGSFNAAFTNYYAKQGTNLRAGQLMSVWDDAGNVEYTDVSTNSLGDTSGVLMFASVNGGDIEIKTTVDSNNWTVKVNTTLL